MPVWRSKGQASWLLRWSCCRGWLGDFSRASSIILAPQHTRIFWIWYILIGRSSAAFAVLRCPVVGHGGWPSPCTAAMLSPCMLTFRAALLHEPAWHQLAESSGAGRAYVSAGMPYIMVVHVTGANVFMLCCLEVVCDDCPRGMPYLREHTFACPTAKRPSCSRETPGGSGLVLVRAGSRPV